MAIEQAREWAEAQQITVSIDLVEATKTHLKFLAAVDKNRFLYEDHALQRAIYRYNAYWLPLLAKHLENPVFDGPLVAPLDCEWIWHCHRLNPARYRFDCEKLYGRILDNCNVMSSVQATSKTATEELWSKLYPEEPFDLDLSIPFSKDDLQNDSLTEKFTSYDLVSAVKRQIPFNYQISRPHMSDDLFLQEAAARYKGFLHLIRTNRKMGEDRVCVPTYDVDLMWHTHILYPDSYAKDMNELMGLLVQHDNSDSGRTKGGILYNSHSETTKQWEKTFGLSYWKAGTMYRGSLPSPVTQVPYEFHAEGDEFKALEKFGPEIQFTKMKAVEVMLEFADIKNLPEEYKENLLIDFSKNQPDKLFRKTSMGLSSNSKGKQVAVFQCEPKGEFIFELMSNSTISNELEPKESPTLLASCSLSLEEMVASRSQLWTNKWVEVDLVSSLGDSKPVLHVFISYSPLIPTPQLFQLENGMFDTVVIDAYGNKVFKLEKSNIGNDIMKDTFTSLEEVYCVTNSGERHALIECNRDYWSIKGTHESFKLQNSSGNDGSLFELVGYNKMVKLFPGRRLEFEPRHLKDENSDQDFMTAVEFSTDYPYGKAVALIDSKLETVKATDDGIILPSIALAFMVSDFTTRSAKKPKLSHEMVENDVQEVQSAECFSACEPCGPGGWRKNEDGPRVFMAIAASLAAECVQVVKNND